MIVSLSPGRYVDISTGMLLTVDRVRRRLDWMRVPRVTDEEFDLVIDALDELLAEQNAALEEVRFTIPPDLSLPSTVPEFTFTDLSRKTLPVGFDLDPRD